MKPQPKNSSRACRRVLLLWTILLALAGASPVRAVDDWDDPDVKLLHYAKVGYRTSDLRRYLRDHSTNDADLARVDQLVNQLGSERFPERKEATRRLLALGQPALPALRRAAKSPDNEVRTRAERCLKEIEPQAKTRNSLLNADEENLPEDARQRLLDSRRRDYLRSLPPYGEPLPRTVPVAVVRLLLHRAPPDTTSLLLRYLPFVTDDALEEEIWFRLDALATQEAKAREQLAACLQDLLPARRAIAGCSLGRLGTPEQRAAVRRLLTDPAPVVRLRSAQGLLAGRDPAAIPSLLTLLEGAPLGLGWQAEELLHWVAGDTAPKTVLGAGKADERHRCRQAWQQWWEQQGGTINLANKDYDRTRPCLLALWEGADGKAEPGVMLFGCDGQVRCRLPNPKETPELAQLLQGILEAKRYQLGYETWHLSPLPIHGIQAIYLPNGNALGGGKGRVAEVDARGQVLWEKFVGQKFVQSRLVSRVSLLGFHQPQLAQEDLALSAPHYQRWLKNPKEQVRRTVFAYLGEFGARIPAAQVALSEQADGVFREPAKDALKRLEESPFSVLVRQLESRDPKVRADTLGDLDRKFRADAKVLTSRTVEMLKDPDENVRYMAANILGGSRFEAQMVVPALMQAARDKNISVRAVAMFSLGRYGKDALPAVPLFLACLKDPHKGIRPWGLMGLDQMRMPAWEEAVIHTLTEAIDNTENDTVSDIAAMILRRCGPSAQPAIPALRKMLNTDPQNSMRQARIASVLQRIGDESDEVVATLVRILADSTTEINVRKDCAYSLGFLGPRAKSSLPALQIARTKANAPEHSRLRELVEWAINRIDDE